MCVTLRVCTCMCVSLCTWVCTQCVCLCVPGCVPNVCAWCVCLCVYVCVCACVSGECQTRDTEILHSCQHLHRTSKTGSLDHLTQPSCLLDPQRVLQYSRASAAATASAFEILYRDEGNNKEDLSFLKHTHTHTQAHTLSRTPAHPHTRTHTHTHTHTHTSKKQPPCLLVLHGTLFILAPWEAPLSGVWDVGVRHMGSGVRGLHVLPVQHFQGPGGTGVAFPIEMRAQLTRVHQASVSY